MKLKIFCVLCATLLIWSCRSTQPDQSLWGDETPPITEGRMPARPVRAAMMLPLSGKNAAMGEAFRNAGIMALYERPDSPLELMFFDTKGTADGMAAAWTEAERQIPDIVIGPIFAEELKSLKKESPDIPVVSFTSDNSLMEPGVYTMGVLIPDQINRLVQFMCESGQNRIAVLSPENKTGELAMNTLTEAVERCPGMAVSKVSIYNPKTVNFDPAVLRIVPKPIDPKKKNLSEEEQILLNTPIRDRLDFDALLIFDDGVRLRQVVSLLSYYDVTPAVVPFYGLTPWQSVRDKNLTGGYFPGITGIRAHKFSARYNSLFGYKPPRLSSLSYDAVSLAAVLAERRALTQTNLTLSAGYNGVDGRFRLNEDGTNERLLEIFQIQPNLSAVTVSPAPTDFFDKNALFFNGLPTTDMPDMSSDPFNRM